MNLHVALVHFPTVDKTGQAVCTSVTNLDVHDFGRASTTYGVRRVWIVHPYEGQKKFLRRVLRHWRDGWGAGYNPTRRESLEGVELVDDIGEIARRIDAEYGQPPLLVGTSARRHCTTISYGDLRARLAAEPERPYLLVFGTGWGLHPEAMELMDLVLEPIYGPTDWNHLSVRAAGGIILDRLCGLAHPFEG